MDTSEQYIKMCEKAKEIHRCRKSEFTGNPAYVFIRTGEGTESNPYYMCWLPRQDQLQEMVRERKVLMGRLVYRFYNWLDSLVVKQEDEWDNYFNNPNLNYESMEQLWLAFVMKEKCDKTWDGENWTHRLIESTQ